MKNAIHQTVHVLGLKPRFLEAHLRVLASCYRHLYRREVRFDVEQVERRIAERLLAERYPKDRTVGVRLELDSEGELTLRPEGESLYRGYVLRALRPEAITLRFALPFEGLPTRAVAATWQLAESVAESRQVRSVVRLDDQNRLCEVDGQTLFAVVGRTIYTPSEPAGVEGRLAQEAIRRAGYRLEVQPLSREELHRVEEIFYADYRGITALNSCDGRLLMSSIAERVALQMEQLVG